jgi:hypothetical protein
MKRPLEVHIAIVVTEQALAFYRGEVSSAEAFSTIDRVCASPFNWYSGILNDTREAFDFAVSTIIAAESPNEWANLLSVLNAQSIRDLTTG